MLKWKMNKQAKLRILVTFGLVLLVSIFFVSGLLGTKNYNNSYTITEYTEYGILENTIYLNITDNVGKDNYLTINHLFKENNLTNQINYKNFEILSEVEKNVTGLVNVSLGKYKTISIIEDTKNSTVIETKYFDDSGKEMTCSYVLADKSCIEEKIGVIGTEKVNEFINMPVTKEKIILSGLKIEQKQDGIPIAKGSTIQLKLTYSHPLSIEKNKPTEEYNKYDIEVCSVDGQYCSILDPTWWNDTWVYNREVIINSTVASTLADYPAKIIMDTSTLISAGKMNSSCKDLRFIDNDNTTSLDFEIENNTCGQTSTPIYVRIPSLTSGNYSIYAYYGNPTALDGQNVAGVWQNFSYVNHMLANNTYPTKPNNQILTAGSAITFSNSSTNITGSNVSVHPQAGSGSSGNWYGTVSGTFSIDTSTANYYHVKFKTGSTGYTGQSYPFNLERTLGSGNGFDFFRCGSDSSLTYCTLKTLNYWMYCINTATQRCVKISPAVPTTTWVSLSAVSNNGADISYIYLNGLPVSSGSTAYSENSINVYSIFGATGTSAQGVNSYYVDEVRLGNFNASADWIKADETQTFWISSTENENIGETNQAPQIVLVYPDNGTTFNYQDGLEFNFNITDDKLIENWTFYINGVAEYSDVSPINGSNSFTINNAINYPFDDGLYNWSVLTFDNESASNQSETRWFTLATTPSESCNYTSGNWVVNCSDNCTINTNLNFLTNNITLYGIGRITLNANLTNWNYINKENSCEIIINQNGGLF